jgi:plasmid stability protein
MDMATLTVRNLDDDVVRRLCIRAPEHGRSAEAEHREILRTVLIADDKQRIEQDEIAAQLAEFRERLAGRGLRPAVELLRESREERVDALTRGREGA